MHATKNTFPLTTCITTVELLNNNLASKHMGTLRVLALSLCTRGKPKSTVYLINFGGKGNAGMKIWKDNFYRVISHCSRWGHSSRLCSKKWGNWVAH